MADIDYTIPDVAGADAASKIEDAVERISDLTVGTRPLAAEVAVAEDTGGELAKGEGTIRIGVLYNGTIAQYSGSHAQKVYDAMEEAGISRPENDPEVGVQIRLAEGNVLIENTLEA